MLGAAALALSGAGCQRAEPAPEPVRAVRTQVVAESDAAMPLEFAAEIRARHETRLGFRVGGKLLARHAELGQSVRRGQLLAELDPADLRLAADAAQASLAAARVSAEQAQSDWRRFQDLKAQGFISAAELERREAALKAAQAQQRAAEAQAGAQNNQTAHARLLAPGDGVVTAVEAERGMVVGAGTPVLRLALEGPRDAVFAVPEDRVAAFRALIGSADALHVRLWGESADLPATVREMAAAADPVTRTYQVRADLGAARPPLGRTATVRFGAPQEQAGVRVPLTALLRREGQTSVWVLDAASMTVRARTVQVAGAQGNEALLAQGLAAGAEIVTAGVHVLAEGQKVTRYQPAAAASGR